MSEKESKEKSEVYQAWADSINKVWKAGLGALSEAEKRGDQLVQTLVEKGKHYEDLVPAAEDAVKDSLSAAKEQATRGVRTIVRFPHERPTRPILDDALRWLG